MNGGTLAVNVLNFCIGFAVVAAFLPILETILHYYGKSTEYIPSAIAFAVGMYVTPNWTIARAVGGLLQYFWYKYRPVSNDKYMILVASGFVLGEGVMSIITAIMATIGVPVYKSH